MDFLYLAGTPLFYGASPKETEEMITCLGARQRHYKKGEAVHHIGDVISTVGLVVSGSVLIENDDVWGNRSILDKVERGQIFGETYACIPGERMMVSVAAAEPSEILFFDVGKMWKVCPNACRHHHRLIQNLLMISAQKNLNLSRRIFHTSSKSIRGRLFSYLSYQSVKYGSREFVLPFNRQQLADYLGVDRSAMSNELSKMQREGLIQLDKNHVRLPRDNSVSKNDEKFENLYYDTEK